MSQSSALLVLEHVTKSYDGGSGVGGPQVLSDVCMQVQQGEALAIMGPSGSGKSTLLNLIGGLDRPSEGQVVFDGANLATMDDQQLAEFRNRQIGFVFQSHHLLPQCTAIENVLIPTLVGQRDPEAPRRAEQLLDRVGLADRMHHTPGKLSGGERQRVAVVRTLINRPRMLLADEPTGSLDRAASEGLAKLIVELNQQDDLTVIVVTHSRELAASMGKVLSLRDGQIVNEGDAS